jgi:hypothetical protein
MLEYLIARSLPTSRDIKGGDAIVIELRKGELKRKDRIGDERPRFSGSEG